MARQVRTVDGRIAGRRGQETRQALLDCVREMLATSPYRDVTVIDIARRARTSPATFYQYFPDVESAILELATEVAREGTELKSLVADPRWTGKSGYQAAEALVDGFLRFWRQHEPVLRVVELAASEGDKRFTKVHLELFNTVTLALAEEIAALQQNGTIGEGVQPQATAGALVAMLASVAGHRRGLKQWKIPAEDLRISMANLLYWGVTGKRPPR
jgi:AcrR family transcriptional regulator